MLETCREEEDVKEEIPFILHELHHRCRKSREVHGRHTGLFYFENMAFIHLIEWEIIFKKTLNLNTRIL